MRLSFVTPLAGLVGLGVLLPALALLERRAAAERARRALGISAAAGRATLLALGALALAGTLVGLAAAQPVLERSERRQVRTDAEVFVVLDVSRSMLAQAGESSPTRLARAKAEAGALRAALPEVRVGLASLTDRLLPHLFPSAAEDVFAATLERSLGVDRPPPRSSLSTIATGLDALRAARSLRFFSPEATKRVLVVYTDGESLPVARARLASALLSLPAIGLVLVHVWGAEERVYSGGAPEPQYEPDAGSRALLEGVAASTQGAVLGEGDPDRVAAKVKALLGDGPTEAAEGASRRYRLAPYLLLAALAPCGLLLWRRER
ncbi:MAG: hypothetical protein KatS3mg012_1350 [Gaiellaceae bacterium]|jgi:hypothetical protein|nr:MAG: hypothetical protein KatS3mg012_1350 [Gaiellaceae bacterium]